jgi:hypothetical protein
MLIPRRGLEKFVREIADQCLISQKERIERGGNFKNYWLFGSENVAEPAMYNKIWAYIDDLDSLLYSPLSLRYRIGDPDIPNIVNDAKGKAASAKMRSLARASDTDTKMSAAVCASLVKGKSFMKTGHRRRQFDTHVIQPECIGVMHETHGCLDEDMEAFTHSMLITPYQFARLIQFHHDRDSLLRKSKNYMRQSRDGGLSPADGAMKQVIVGGLYPFQAAGSSTPNNTRGIVNWMGGPSPTLHPEVLATLMQLDEVWIWDDERQDWATFQIIGDMLIFGKYAIQNIFAFNPDSKKEDPDLKGHHPFTEFCPNPIEGYFYGRSEITNVALLQEAINSRIRGTNRLLRLQEDPPKRFSGSTGVNQQALSRFSKPGGYWSDSNPNAKVDTMAPTLPPDLWASLHEYERMFDEMGGLPPIARGKGDAGVRSHAHAETLVRMFSPRFKDRALLVERSVAAQGMIMLELAKAHVDKKLIAWVPEEQAGIEASPVKNPLLIPPFKGAVPVLFQFADLDEDSTLSVDSHSSSPAFAADAKALAFDLFKIGAMSAEDIVEHTDAPDPEQLSAGIKRREIAKAEEAQREQNMKLITGGKHK